MKPRTRLIVLANLIAFVAGATVPSGTPATRVAKPLFPTTQKAAVDVTAVISVPAVPVQATPSEPIVPALVREVSREKKLFYQVALDGTGKVPSGCLPYMVDGGLLFDADPKTPGWQEDSAWVYGYNGQGATAANGWKATGEFRQHAIPAKVRQLAKQIPAGTLYILDVEHWPMSASANGDAAVEDTIRKFRAVLVPFAAARPEGEIGVYGIIPEANYTAASNFGGSMRALGKLQRGEAMTELEYWFVGGVADYDRWGTGTLRINKNAQHYAAWLRVQADDDRLTYGLTAAGKKDAGGGISDAITISAPSCYDHQVGDDSQDYIEQSVAEARRINPGKPVYVFMSGNHVGGSTGQLDLGEWQTELAQAFAVADGVILWNTNVDHDPAHVAAAQAALAQARRGGKN